MMHKFLLKERVGWGNEIHIKIGDAMYAGSGRCLKGTKITYDKPTIKELSGEISISGHLSHPFISKGDIIVVETHVGDSVELIATEISYYRDPRDMFIGKAMLHMRYKQKLRQKTLIIILSVLFLSLILTVFFTYKILSN